MDTQGGKNWGYPVNAKRKKGKKKTWERQIKRQNQTNQHPEQQQKTRQPTKRSRFSSRHGFQMLLEPLPRGLSPPYLGNARSDGDAIREKSRVRNFNFSGLHCMSPESCSKVLSAAKMRFNGCWCYLCEALPTFATLSSPPAVPLGYNAFPATPDIISYFHFFRRPHQNIKTKGQAWRLNKSASARIFFQPIRICGALTGCCLFHSPLSATINVRVPECAWCTSLDPKMCWWVAVNRYNIHT